MTSLNRDIIRKVIDCKSTKANAEKTVEWLSTTMEGQHELSDMIDYDAYMLEEGTLDNKELIDTNQSTELLKRIEQKIKRNHSNKVKWIVAASVLPFILLISIGTYINHHFDIYGKASYTDIYIPKGKKAHIIFQDGSEAYVNSDTKITYPKKFGFKKREVSIEGEAYFNIAQNKYRPFIVYAENTSIKVLGTSFNVSAYSNDDALKITLDEGSILFDNSQNTYQLSKGQELIFNKNNKESFIRAVSNSENNSLWKYDIIYFYDTPLSEVVKTLEREFDIRFVIKDNNVFNYSYTTTSDAKNIEDIIRELEKISPVKFSYTNGTYEIDLK